MNKDTHNISFSDDGAESFDLDGIIINPVGNQSNDDASSSDAVDAGRATGNAHAIDGNEILEESGIEILREGKSIDLEDPDLM